ncbi:MAG TPA: hypothetical protein VMW08_05600 [Acidimicrobiales bacterium]|nr:hypothetical protein [Acidimicrobiales bacterium]
MDNLVPLRLIVSPAARLMKPPRYQVLLGGFDLSWAMLAHTAPA